MFLAGIKLDESQREKALLNSGSKMCLSYLRLPISTSYFYLEGKSFTLDYLLQAKNNLDQFRKSLFNLIGKLN